ncbi:MAG: efflux RND transporter periplasmic adaptor subunit [Myxococcaceae bacterium]
MKHPAIAILIAALGGASCSDSHPSLPGPSGAPAAVVPPTSLDGLATVVLRPDSATALGIEVGPVEQVPASRSFIVGGEVMVPAGRDVVLAAPASGRIATAPTALPRPGEHVRAGQALLSLIPIASVDRDVRARATRDLETARADLVLADARFTRAEAMVADRSGSQRNLDEARAQKQVAAAAVSAAESRLRTIASGSLDSDVALSVRSPVDGIVRTVRVTLGQSVPQGASLIEIAGTGRWVRASFAASDAQSVATLREVRARRLGSLESLQLAPVIAPPSADPIRGTVDRFFMLPDAADWTPGERVLVEVVVASQQPWLAVPFTAIVRDAEGSSWVYEQAAPLSFRRRRVEPIRREGERMLLARGLAQGALVVSVGATELWGFELGADR